MADKRTREMAGAKGRFVGPGRRSMLEVVAPAVALRAGGPPRSAAATTG